MRIQFLMSMRKVAFAQSLLSMPDSGSVSAIQGVDDVVIVCIEAEP